MLTLCVVVMASKVVSRMKIEVRCRGIWKKYSALASLSVLSEVLVGGLVLFHKEEFLSYFC